MGRVKVTHLSPGVHARIGPPRSDHPDRMSADPGDRLFQHALHCPSVRLALETEKIRPVVGDDHFQPRHFRTPCMAGRRNMSLRARPLPSS